jgi:hypothetical protein
VTISIDQWIADLKGHRAEEVDQYERKLKSFGRNEQKVFEMLSEARAAMLFLRNGWQVTMQDRPDLLLKFRSEVLGAEVKHFNFKGTDQRDNDAMAAAGEFEFVKIGNVIDNEGKHAWQQMCANAIHKEPQYLDGFPNILIFVSYNDSLDLMLRSAVNEFDDEVRRAGPTSPLRKLGGMMMLAPNNGPSTSWSNIGFCPTAHPHHPIGYKLVFAMGQAQIA